MIGRWRCCSSVAYFPLQEYGAADTALAALDITGGLGDERDRAREKRIRFFGSSSCKVGGETRHPARGRSNSRPARHNPTPAPGGCLVHAEVFYVHPGGRYAVGRRSVCKFGQSLHRGSLPDRHEQRVSKRDKFLVPARLHPSQRRCTRRWSNRGQRWRRACCGLQHLCRTVF